MRIFKYIAIIFLALLFVRCELTYVDYEPSTGDVDFSSYVALGDSYSAGYTNGALGKKGQLEGFTYILSEQIKTLGDYEFVQPLVTSEGSIGTTLIAPNTYNSYFSLQVANGSLQPVPGVGNPAIFAERVYSSEKPVQNLGVPGAKVSHLLAPGYAQMNPFYARFASSLTTSVKDDALALNPSFISLWIGNNDVLSYALEGGEDDEITDPTAFNTYLNGLAASLFGTSTKGAIANIPDIDGIPYINYILAKGHISFLIEDEDVVGGMRQLLEGEKVLLSASQLLQAGYGQSSDKPIPAEYILDMEELSAIRSATTEFNKSIKQVAETFNLAFVDLNALMKSAGTMGVFVDGNRYTSDFVTGGVFSLDGIHSTAKGSAIIANEFIKAINSKYNSTIPLAIVNDYEGIIFP